MTMTLPPDATSSVVMKLKTRGFAVTAPDGRSAALGAVWACTVTIEPPRAAGVVPEPAVSMFKLAAAEMVEAVTVKAGAAARSAGPFVLDTVKVLTPAVLEGVPAAPVAGQEAVGVV